MPSLSKLNSKVKTSNNLKIVCLTSSIASIYYLIKLYRKSRLKSSEDSALLLRQIAIKPPKNKDFNRKLRQLLQILIPTWTSPEIGYMAMTSIVLVLRSVLDVWTIYLGTLLESAIITMDNRRFNRHLIQFAMTMPSMAITNAMLKYTTDKLTKSFRTRLTRRLTAAYMENLTFYKLSLKTSTIDQLITNDVNLFSTTLSNLYTTTSKPILDIIIYVYGISSSLGLSVPAQMLAYLAIAAGVLLKMRKPMSRMTSMEQEYEGMYRNYHNRVITNAEEIAFYGGNHREMDILSTCYDKLMEHSDKFIAFRFFINYMENIVAKYSATVVGYYSVSRPFFTTEDTAITRMSQEARLESYYKSGRMLIKLAQAIGRLVLNGKDMSRLSGYTGRVHELLTTIDNLNSGKDTRNYGVIVNQDNIIKFENVPIVTPNGDVLVKELNLTITTGQNVLVAGPNGCGKSSLARILGELWPLRSGTLTKPHKSKLFYVPQRPYMTVGSLRDQIIYPDNLEMMKAKSITDDDIVELLRRVSLEWIVIGDEDTDAKSVGKRRSLDDCDNWIDVLSGGQKQRVAMARLLYHRPQFAILDECTSAVSVDVEGSIYNYCRQLGITLFTVTHRKSLWCHHDFVLHMDGLGSYTFQPINAQMEAYGS